MKIGAHEFIFTDALTDRNVGVLETARALGLECFEIAVGDDAHFTPSLVRREAERLGLDLILSPGAGWPAAYDLSSEKAEERQAGLRWQRRQLDLAAEAGAVMYAGALYGHPGTVVRRRPTDDLYARTAEGLHALGEYARRRGLPLALEPMSHFRTHVATTPQQLVALIERADCDNLYVLLDTYHMVTEVRDYRAAVRAAGGRLAAVHACENDRGRPGGGIVPWDDVFRGLKEVAFDGYVVMETYNTSLALGEFAASRGIFLPVCEDAAAFVREGAAFLRAGFARHGVPAHDLGH